MRGESWATREIGDRLDGKPVQGVELDMNVKITRIERHIVDVRVNGPVAILTAPLVALPAPDEVE